MRGPVGIPAGQQTRAGLNFVDVSSPPSPKRNAHRGLDDANGRQDKSPAGTLQSVAGHGSARWDKFKMQSSEGRHNLFLGIEAVYSQKAGHLLSVIDSFVVLALIGDVFHNSGNLGTAHAASEISFLPFKRPDLVHPA
jgi:hypothetical protein